MFLPVFLTAVSILFTVLMAGYILWFYKGSFQEETAGETYDRYYMMITRGGGVSAACGRPAGTGVRERRGVRLLLYSLKPC